MSTIELAGIWEGLISGDYKVKSCSYTKKTWSLALSRRRGEAAPCPPRRDLEILKHVLLCGVTAQVAAQANLSRSSIAVIQQNCLEFMGINCTPLRVPGLVLMAAHAHHRSRRVARSKPITKITISRPDLALASMLSAAEYEVVKLLVEGLTYAEIGRERNTSIRTVANQVAAIFRRLGVSGRVHLLCLLADACVT